MIYAFDFYLLINVGAFAFSAYEWETISLMKQFFIVIPFEQLYIYRINSSKFDGTIRH